MVTGSPPGCRSRRPRSRPRPPRAPPRRQQEVEDEDDDQEDAGGGGGGGGLPPQPRPKGCVYRLGSTQCRRCLITFPDAAFAARHAKRQHPRDFAAAALRGALFVCFVCARPFASSPALLRHQRAHAPPATPAPTPTPRPAPPAPPAYACTECGRAFAREGALHRHYIRHARGEL
ncbi:zinc finger protein 576-like [Accipiter gentilis]|uniref:zinc finger protein 576-like n=1 Tax=Astur gentilis TaxID=8957 RepID=UPI002110A591|nr:zinc finger protein 576-like [Accipiter gentilis]